jgi:hypothetical protein
MNSDDCLVSTFMSCIVLGFGIYVNAPALIIPCSIVLLLLVIMIIIKAVKGEI